MKILDKVQPTTKGLILGVLALSVIGFAIGAFFVPHLGFFAIGIILGCFMSVIKVILLERSVNKIIESTDKKYAVNAMRLGSVSRFFLSGVALIFAALFLQASGVIGVFISTLALTLSAFFVRFFIKDDDKTTKPQN